MPCHFLSRVLPLFLVFLTRFVSGQTTESTSTPSSSIYDRHNLVAWCIVPFDEKKRGPEERAAMLQKLGFKFFAYDYRAEHIPQWEEEMAALKRHGVELTGWWFPGAMNDEAKKILDLLKRHNAGRCDLWITGSGQPTTTPEEQSARVTAEANRIEPIARAAADQNLRVGLYNHGNWFGEPENQIEIIDALKSRGLKNVGIIYNLHHGHGHLARLPSLLQKMMPYLYCVNLNGMDVAGDAKGRKILPLGVGTEDVQVLKVVRDSGYKGPIGILNHTNADAEGRLEDNLKGLDWLVKQLDGAPAGPAPRYTTWREKTGGTEPEPTLKSPVGVAAPEPYGKALSGAMLVKGSDEYRKFPISIECRAKLSDKNGFNILLACDPKKSATHWELYSYRGTGNFSVYLPGRGGEFVSSVNICDDRWHDLVAVLEENQVQLFVDNKLVLEKPTQPHKGESQPGDLAFCRLVEGGFSCKGLLDDVRISRGVIKPRKVKMPLNRMDVTLGLWDFNDLSDRPDNANAAVVESPAPVAFEPERAPLQPTSWPGWDAAVNRDRIFDYYAKQAQQFKKVKPTPELIASYPGLDGGSLGHWGNQNEETWRDGRWNERDHGGLLTTAIKVKGLTIAKAVCLRFGDDGRMAAVFDPETLSFPIITKGEFLEMSSTRHGFMNGVSLAGQIIKLEAGVRPTEKFRYQGFYRHGSRVIFAYELNGVAILDTISGAGSKFKREKDKRETHPDRELIKGGPAQWPKRIELKGNVGRGKPFALDTIPIPFENPYGTLFFISGHDFFSDGTAAVATMTGEIWLVRGLDDKLDHVRWKRYATGLYQPLGVKIVNDHLYVLGRDQITQLHDLNGDDEADFYECVTNEQITSPGGHDFITGLDCDAEGRFYFASANQGVCRVKPGQPVEVLATGFRNPNGLGLAEDGTITTSVQEGDWTPASAICLVKLGAHFGAGGPRKGEKPAPPLIYLPRGEDNSSGGQCFVKGDTWSALKGDGNFLHFSPGAGAAFLVMRQKVGDQWQGAAVRIMGGFESGAQTGRFHPRDGQLYVTGMQGWGSYTPKDGCFQRVRYTPSSVPVPTSFEARENGILLRFSEPLDKAAASDVSQHFVQCWNYPYSPAYGSPEFSVKHPKSVGHDVLAIKSAHVLADSRSLFLEVPQLTPASMIHVQATTGPEQYQDFFITAHALASEFTNFPGYQHIAKAAPAPAAQTMLTMPPPAKPNPWVNSHGKTGRVVKLEAALGLQFAQRELHMKAGEAITLEFKNPDVVPHNWVLARPGTLDTLGGQVNLLIADPQALSRHYIPDSKDVLYYTDMTNPGASFTIHITAPSEKGSYPYLCTFPGHWQAMNGVLKVE